MPCFPLSAGKRDSISHWLSVKTACLKNMACNSSARIFHAIKAAEDRLLFRETMQKNGIPIPHGGAAYSLTEAEEITKETGYPVLVRASFAMGGTGASWVYEPAQLQEAVRSAISESPIGQAWLEESVLGWKEYELEVMRDKADNFVVVCSIENLDPMGVHTGDSITVAPAQTLTDREYQILRDLAHRVLTAVGVETGGSNVQFGVDPKTGRVVVIEMNPRVSRSSALASKATGFPIAKLAALGCCWLHPRRNHQRHHQTNQSRLRAFARLCRCQNSALGV